MTVHVFNPEHDLALAEGTANYTPPKVVRQLRKDLGWISSLWKAEGEVTVWGWDKAITKELKQQGVPAEMLPTAERLDAIRELSNRSLAVEMLASLNDMEGTTGHSEVCHTYEEVLDFAEPNGDTVVKAPWSSSGRGVKRLTETSKSFIVNTIARQGSVITETWCDKVIDFALEYTADKQGMVHYEGLSLFHTAGGAYKGNLLLPEREKRQMLSEYVDEGLVATVSERIRQYLSLRLEGIYSGPLGVDMMVCKLVCASERQNQRGDLNLLNPCIEINLRRTMGHVALALTRQGHRGTMTVLYNKERNKYELNIKKTVL